MTDNPVPRPDTYPSLGLQKPRHDQHAPPGVRRLGALVRSAAYEHALDSAIILMLAVMPPPQREQALSARAATALLPCPATGDSRFYEPWGDASGEKEPCNGFASENDRQRRQRPGPYHSSTDGSGAMGRSGSYVGGPADPAREVMRAQIARWRRG